MTVAAGNGTAGRLDSTERKFGHPIDSRQHVVFVQALGADAIAHAKYRIRLFRVMIK